MIKNIHSQKNNKIKKTTNNSEVNVKDDWQAEKKKQQIMRLSNKIIAEQEFLKSNLNCLSEKSLMIIYFHTVKKRCSNSFHRRTLTQNSCKVSSLQSSSPHQQSSMPNHSNRSPLIRTQKSHAHR